MSSVSSSNSSEETSFSYVSTVGTISELRIKKIYLTDKTNSFGRLYFWSPKYFYRDEYNITCPCCQRLCAGLVQLHPCNHHLCIRCSPSEYGYLYKCNDCRICNAKVNFIQHIDAVSYNSRFDSTFIYDHLYHHMTPQDYRNIKIILLSMNIMQYPTLNSIYWSKCIQMIKPCWKLKVLEEYCKLYNVLLKMYPSVFSCLKACLILFEGNDICRLKCLLRIHRQNLKPTYKLQIDNECLVNNHPIHDTTFFKANRNVFEIGRYFSILQPLELALFQAVDKMKKTGNNSVLFDPATLIITTHGAIHFRDRNLINIYIDQLYKNMRLHPSDLPILQYNEDPMHLPSERIQSIAGRCIIPIIGIRLIPKLLCAQLLVKTRNIENLLYYIEPNGNNVFL